jgi:hypothetical protein
MAGCNNVYFSAEIGFLMPNAYQIYIQYAVLAQVQSSK